MNWNILILAAVATTTLFADDSVDYLKITGIRTRLRRIYTTEEIKDEKGAIFRNLLVRFSVTPVEGSRPPSFIVAGKVIDNNAGVSQELVPILFSSPSDPLQLAALTNVDGEFRFRIWQKEDHREGRLQTPKLDDGVLYVGRSPNGLLDGEVSNFLSYAEVYAYSFRELLAGASAKSKTEGPK